jgi:hypothetical protein
VAPLSGGNVIKGVGGAVGRGGGAGRLGGFGHSLPEGAFGASVESAQAGAGLHIWSRFPNGS